MSQHPNGPSTREPSRRPGDDSRKQFAMLLTPDGQRETTIRNVWHQDDWALMHKTGRDLVCFHLGCDQRLTAVQTAGTRFLRCKNGRGCGHVHQEAVPVGFAVDQTSSGAGSGGGVMSPEHRFMQVRLAHLLTRPDFLASGERVTAVLEHGPTHADVWVPEKRIALEVQRWNTNFVERARIRAAAGAQTTVWFVPHNAPGLSSRQVNQIELTQLVARYTLRPAGNRGGVLEIMPWDEVDPQLPLAEQERLLALQQQKVWLSVSIRALRWEKSHRRWRWSNQELDGMAFLRNVLTAKIVWCPPRTPGLPVGALGGDGGGWVWASTLERRQMVTQRKPLPIAVPAPMAARNDTGPMTGAGRPASSPLADSSAATTTSSIPSAPSSMPSSMNPRTAAPTPPIPEHRRPLAPMAPDQPAVPTKSSPPFGKVPPRLNNEQDQDTKKQPTPAHPPHPVAASPVRQLPTAATRPPWWRRALDRFVWPARKRRR